MTMKRSLNWLRNLWLFRIRYPWVRYGQDVHCQASVFMNPPRRQIRLGNHVGIGPYSFFLADTEIGNHVLIAPCVAFLNARDHRFDVVGETMWNSGRGEPQQIVVEDDVWIGHGAIILAPSRLGRGAIVAAGSVVVSNVPPYAIVGGNPARLLKMRFTPEQIIEHERVQAEGTRPASESRPAPDTPRP